MTTALRKLTVCLFAALIPAIAMLTIFVWPSWKVWRHGVPVDGVVMFTQPSEHRSVRYRYTYEGKDYEYGSQGGSGIGNPPYKSLQPGSKLHLWVTSEDPDKALPGDPYPPFRDSLVFVLVGYGVFAIIGFWKFDTLRNLTGR